MKHIILANMNVKV